MKPAITSKYLITAIFFFILLASACTTYKQVPVFPTAAFLSPTSRAPSSPTVGAASTITSPALPPAATPPEPSFTSRPESPTDTPVPDGAVIWAEGLDIQLRDIAFSNWVWSPADDEIVGFLAKEHNDMAADTVLVHISAPDFRPQQIRIAVPKSLARMDMCIHPNLLWHPYGQRIFFSGPIVNPSGPSFESCSLWMVEHDGSNPRLYYPQQSGRLLSSLGWVDDHTLLMSGYREGIRLFDLLTGEVVNWAYPSYFGRRLITRDYFVGADGSDGFTQMFVLGRRDEPILMTQSDELGPMRYANFSPNYDLTCNCYIHSLPYDALAGTNKVLAYLFGEVIDSNDPDNVKIFPVRKLGLWDIDQNTLSTLVPYGYWGQFSPDMRTLAYLTNGPALQDAENKPVDPLITKQNISYDLDIENAYLQLLDFSDSMVFLSVPVVSLRDTEYNNYIHAGINFSPDGRFLSFVTDREITFDDNGWPKMAQTNSAAKKGGFMYVLDLKNRRLIFEQSDLAPVPHGTGSELTFKDFLAHWSPKSNQFIYLDARNNPILVNLDTGVQSPISLKMSGRPDIEWSASGKYVALAFANPLKMGFLRVP